MHEQQVGAGRPGIRQLLHHAMALIVIAHGDMQRDAVSAKLMRKLQLAQKMGQRRRLGLGGCHAEQNPVLARKTRAFPQPADIGGKPVRRKFGHQRIMAARIAEQPVAEDAPPAGTDQPMRPLAVAALPEQLAIMFRGAAAFWSGGEIADDQFGAAVDLGIATSLIGYVPADRRDGLTGRIARAAAVLAPRSAAGESVVATGSQSD